MQIQTILKNYGLSEKEISVYLALIELGPSPVRSISAKSKVNRGTTYDILKDLMKQGIVSYYNKESKQYFVAEEPEKLITAIDQKKEDLDEIRTNIKENLPFLKTLFEKQGGKPVIKLYEGNKGIRFILEDVLSTLKNQSDKLYYVYSSSDVKNELYKAYKDFNKDRLRHKISNKVIAFGKGGELVGLDERKWMNAEHGTPTYIIIYSGKVAMISISSSGEPIGVIMEDQGLYQTQKMIFEFNWRQL
jgi:HTH-type transcriptional regulator, sugar sensing transcriptional regulator